MTINKLTEFLDSYFFYEARDNGIDVLSEEYKSEMKSLARKINKILKQDKTKTLESVLENLF